MKSLPNTVKDEFEKCSHWVLSKTMNKFSAIPFDQAHEQENKIRVAVGLTEKPVASDDGCSQGQRWRGFLTSLKENTLRMMTQRA